MDINAFLNSNFFLGFVTILVGSAAYATYKFQRRGHKKDAASIVVLELQGALRQLKVIKKHLEDHKSKFGSDMDVGMIPADIKLMPSASWSQYKYLFVRNLDRDAWDAVSAFYDNTLTYDKSVEMNNDGFTQNSQKIREVTAHAAMDVLKEFVIANPANKPGSKSEKMAVSMASEMTRILLRNINIDLLSYRPQKPIQDAVLIIELLDTSELSLALQRLKKFAKIKN